MITYRPFWETLHKSSENTYTLIHDHGMSSSTVDKLRHNKTVSTETLNRLCEIFGCKLADIAEYTQ